MSITLFANQPNTLPNPRIPLVGRAAELATARALLLDDAVPLLTLTGTGGVGKTRLALAIADEVAESFVDGVVFVDLAPIRDPALVIVTIAHALDVRDTGYSPLAQHLTSFLRPRQLLLLLDNCEQVLAAAPHVADLLAACPALQVLATSRSPLHLRSEHELPVEPLSFPTDATTPVAAMAEVDAVALFLQRARAVLPAFVPTDEEVRTIAGCCQRLDGLPLAIELAAARLKVLSPSSLLALLSDRLRLLTGGARDLPERQRTLRDAIAWSYDLLAPDECRLFDRLAVFSGGFDLAAAAAVDGSDPIAVVERIAALVDQSVLRRVDRFTADSQMGSRFSMLETVHEFARECLHDGEEETEARRAHALYFLALVEQAEAEMYSPEMGRWLDRLEEEHANIRTALDTFAETGDVVSELRLAASLIEFWWQRGHLREGIDRLEGALQRGSNAPLGPRAKAVAVLSGQYGTTGNISEWLALSARGVDWAREADDVVVTAFALWCRALALRGRGHQDDVDEELRLLREGVGLLLNRAPAPWVLSYLLGELGDTLISRGERDRGIASIEEALVLDRARGEGFGAGVHLAMLGVHAGVTAEAASRFAESLHSLWSIRDSMTIGWPLLELARLGLAHGHDEQAARLFGAVVAIRERTGSVILMTQTSDESIDDQIERVARTNLGDEGFAAAIAKGRHAPLAEIVTEARAMADVLAHSTNLPVALVASAPLPAPRTPPTVSFGLSPREREVLALLAQRLTDPEVAEALFISPRTVNAHVTRIFNKLGVNSRRDAAALAARHRLV